MRYVEKVHESIALNDLREPCIIISASGMCEAGRVLHHLKHNIEDPRGTVLIAGYQAPDTLGRRLVERRPEVRILGRTTAAQGRGGGAQRPVQPRRSCGAAGEPQLRWPVPRARYDWYMASQSARRRWPMDYGRLASRTWRSRNAAKGYLFVRAAHAAQRSKQVRLVSAGCWCHSVDSDR